MEHQIALFIDGPWAGQRRPYPEKLYMIRIAVQTSEAAAFLPSYAYPSTSHTIVDYRKVGQHGNICFYMCEEGNNGIQTMWKLYESAIEAQKNVRRFHE